MPKFLRVFLFGGRGRSDRNLTPPPNSKMHFFEKSGARRMGMRRGISSPRATSERRRERNPSPLLSFSHILAAFFHLKEKSFQKTLLFYYRNSTKIFKVLTRNWCKRSIMEALPNQNRCFSYLCVRMCQPAVKPANGGRTVVAWERPFFE